MPTFSLCQPWSFPKVISPLQAFSSAIRRPFVQYFTKFQLTARSRSPPATAGLLVFISEVSLLWKLLAFVFVATMQLLSNYFALLF